jgi:hypothetical protein
MTKEQEWGIWYSMLTADMSARYWLHAARRYHGREKKANVVVALSASTAFLGVFVFHPIWATLAAVAALVSAWLLVFDLRSTIEGMTSAATKWKTLCHSYEKLWAALPALETDEALARFDSLKSTEQELIPLEAKLPVGDKWLQWAYREVLASRGLSVQGRM